MVFRRLQHAHVAVPVGLNGSGGFVLMKNNFPDSLTKKFGGMFALHHENIDFRINLEENLMIWYQNLVFRWLQHHYEGLSTTSNYSEGSVSMKNNSPSGLTRKVDCMFATQ